MALILVIDDDDDVRSALRRRLEQTGYEVITAADGADGIRLFRESPVDLIITDIIMPELNGITAILELKQESPDVKIIAISGGGFIEAEEYLYMARVVGVERTFTKPFAGDELLKAVGEILGEKAKWN